MPRVHKIQMEMGDHSYRKTAYQSGLTTIIVGPLQRLHPPSTTATILALLDIPYREAAVNMIIIINSTMRMNHVEECSLVQVELEEVKVRRHVATILLQAASDPLEETKMIGLHMAEIPIYTSVSRQGDQIETKIMVQADVKEVSNRTIDAMMSGSTRQELEENSTMNLASNLLLEAAVETIDKTTAGIATSDGPQQNLRGARIVLHVKTSGQTRIMMVGLRRSRTNIVGGQISIVRVNLRAVMMGH